MAKGSKKTGNLDDLSFEDAIETLTGIVESVEQGDVPLQDSLQQYEKGMGLIKHCRTLLQQAEKRIQKISEQDDMPDEPE
jgi:exodeoxyribonuclease VII small subunit